MFRYFAHIWRLRPFWAALVRIDLRRRYRRSVLGMGWSLLHPIAMTVVICTVFSQIFKADIRTYGPFLMTGLVFWSFISSAAVAGCQSFFQGESYIRQHPAPLAIYSLRTTLGAGIHFLLALAVVLPFVWCVHGFGNLPYLVTLLPTLVLLFLLGWAIATSMSVINVLFQDTQHIVEVALQVLFYITPIMYPSDMLKNRHLEWFINLNPLAAFLELLRRPMVDGCWPSANAVAVATGMTALLVVAAAVTLAKIERRIIFYL